MASARIFLTFPVIFRQVFRLIDLTNDANEAMIERLDDLELAQIAKARIETGEEPVRVSLDDLTDEAEADIANGR